MRLLPVLLLAGLVPLQISAIPSSASSYTGPVKVELLKYLSVRQVHSGSSLFVRVASDWSGLGCNLRSGAIIEGSVVLANPRTRHIKSSQLALSFTSAQCGGMEMAPMRLMLAAVAAAPEEALPVPVIRNMGNPRGVPEGAVSSLEQLSTQMELANNPRSPQVRTPAFGEVSGVRGIKLDVGAGPEHSSVLSAKDRDIALEAHTELLLVPSSVVFDAAAQSVPSSVDRPDHHLNGTTSRASAKSDVLHLAETSTSFTTCSPPSCTTELPSASNELSSRPATAIPIRSLGYAPRPNASIHALNNDDSVAWLGKDRVLLAFNPHRLIHREGLMTADAPLRSIHAVVIDVRADRVIASLDWELPDSGRYLWQLSADRILVHAGRELRIYDSELHLTSRLLLPGPLAFLRVSPNGQLISLGICRERHTPALHVKLQSDLGRQPDEDLDILVVDQNFKSIAHTTSTSGIVPPTLLNEGQLMLLAQPDNMYRLELLGWEGKSSTLARFRSSCAPDIGSISPDLVFIRSCGAQGNTPEFRVMRPDGRLLLKGIADSGELSHEAKGEPSSRAFAVKVLSAAPSVKLGFPFHGDELLAENLKVYRASDGKRLAAVRAKAPAPSHGGYALSPDGTQLALVAGAQLTIYAIPSN
jgi:hypothetical protein